MIVGFVGLIGSGKGTAADYLVQKHSFVKESFAGSVKDAAAQIFSWERSLLEGETEFSRWWREQPDPYWSNKFGYEFSPRKALQLLGTEVGRKIFDEDIWVHTVFRRLISGQRYVISDVRFPNEIKHIKMNGGLVYRVKRGEDPSWLVNIQKFEYDNESMKAYMESKHPEVHYSEWAWANCEFDEVIENDYGILEFENNIKNILSLHGIIR